MSISQCNRRTISNKLLLNYYVVFLHVYLTCPFSLFIKSILKALVIPAMWLALSGAIYSRIVLSFALNRIFFSANDNGTVKPNNQSDFKALLN